MQEVLNFHMGIFSIGAGAGLAIGSLAYVLHICISQVSRIFKQIQLS